MYHEERLGPGGRPLRTLTPSLSRRHAFGAEVRRLRLIRNWSQRRLADAIFYSPEIVSKIERAERWPTLHFASCCDAVLETGGALVELWPAVWEARLSSDRRRRPSVAPVTHPSRITSDLAGQARADEGAVSPSH